ncbi:9705_t:CDS:2, partial [Cetraspora pellucida]
TAQDAMREINEENALVSVLVKDYAGQNYDFIVKIVEVIDGELYANAVDISFIDVPFSKLLSAHQSAHRNRNKAHDGKSSFDRSVTDLIINDCHSSKRVKVDDYNDHAEYIDSYYNNDKYSDEYSRNYTDESIEYRKNVISENREKMSNSKNLNKSKEKEIQSVVHNTKQ